MTDRPKNSNSVSEISAVDEEGTKFYLIENDSTSNYHLQTTSDFNPSQIKIMSQNNGSNQTSQSSTNPMDFNLWMFQQHQAAISAFVNGDGATSSVNNPPSGKSGATKPSSTMPDTSSQVTIPEHLFSMAPNGFEAVPLVLPPSNSTMSPVDKATLNSSLNAPDSPYDMNIVNKQEGPESSKHYKTPAKSPELEESRKNSSGKLHRSRSRTKQKRRSSHESSSENDDESRNADRRNKSKKKDKFEEHDGDSESRKRKRSPESPHIKKGKKAKKEKKKRKASKKSKKKKSKASRIPVAEVDDRSCSGTPERYQKNSRSSDGESLQSDLDSVSSSSFISSSSGELSYVSNSLSSISDEELPRATSKSCKNKDLKGSSGRSKIFSPTGRGRGIDGFKIPKRSPRRRRSSDRETSPRNSSPRKDRSRTSNMDSDRRSSFRRTASRFDDNVRLEDSLQKFRERKGMTPYSSSSSSVSPGKRSSYDNRHNSSTSNVESMSRESSIISTPDTVTTKDVDKSGEDKHPLSGDDVGPMDRMRIDQYLIGCKHKYTFNSCGSIPFVDSHCHIDFLFKKTDFKGTFTKFQELVPFPENYGGCVAVFCEPYTFGRFSVFEKILAEDKLVACFGCHPHSANQYNDALERNIINMMSHPKVVAWGECGLDFSDRSRGVDKVIQRDVFRRQLKWAVKLKKPICLHSRQSDEELFEILKEEVSPDHKLHRHCYTETPDQAIKMLQYFKNMYFGFTNVLAYSNAADARHTAAIVPLERILLETDAPYFLPPKAPKSMKNSNPGMAIQVAEQLSFIKRVPVQEVLMQVRKNTQDMYGI